MHLRTSGRIANRRRRLFQFPANRRVCEDLRAIAIRIIVNSKGRTGIVKNRCPSACARTRGYYAIVAYLGMTYGYIPLKDWKFASNPVKVSLWERRVIIDFSAGYSRGIAILNSSLSKATTSILVCHREHDVSSKRVSYQVNYRSVDFNTRFH